jgi:hypothetical protein
LSSIDRQSYNCVGALCTGINRDGPRGVRGMPFVDKTLHCLDCGKEFVFSAHEQEFYASKGLTNEPLRCKDCRDARDLPASSDDVV